MGLQTTKRIICDYSGCKVDKGSPSVIQWVHELVENGQQPMPEEAKYLVIFNMNGVAKTFCCQLHAAEFFLPPGYEARQKDVIEVPKTDRPKTTLPWHRRPVEPETSPDNGQGEPDERC